MVLVLSLETGIGPPGSKRFQLKISFAKNKVPQGLSNLYFLNRRSLTRVMSAMENVRSFVLRPVLA